MAKDVDWALFTSLVALWPFTIPHNFMGYVSLKSMSRFRLFPGILVWCYRFLLVNSSTVSTQLGFCMSNLLHIVSISLSDYMFYLVSMLKFSVIFFLLFILLYFPFQISLKFLLYFCYVLLQNLSPFLICNFTILHLVRLLAIGLAPLHTLLLLHRVAILMLRILKSC